MFPSITLGWFLLVTAFDLPTVHEANPVFAEVLQSGITLGEEQVPLPAPTFQDGQSAEEQRELLQDLAGSARGVEALLRDSVTAPFLLKLRDTRQSEATLRAGVLYFVLYADLDELDPAELSQTDTRETGPVEAGNMRFKAQLLDASDLESSPVEAVDEEDEWYVHSQGRLLDRVAVETTTRLTVTRSADSIVQASKTDQRFDGHEAWPNHWATIERRNNEEIQGEPQPYEGGIGYTNIQRLKGVEGALLVEAHFAFIEPRAWFDGAPILRSKFSLIAQDQVRKLRRELAAER